jgi:hypothetical protein
VTRQRFQKASLKLQAATAELRTALSQADELAHQQENALQEFRDAISDCTGVDINLGMAYRVPA